MNRRAEIILGLSPFALGILIFFWIVELPRSSAGYADFRQLYVAGYMVRTGQGDRLYNYDSQLQLQNALTAPAPIAMPFVRPAYQAIVFAPLSIFSYKTAFRIWLGINIMVALVSYLLIRKRVPHPLAFFLFAPLSIALIEGQDSVLWLALFVLAFTAIQRGSMFAAGALIAFGLFKFQIAIPIALTFLIWRQWRFISGFISLSAVLGIASIGLIGKAGRSDLYHGRMFAPSGFGIDYLMMGNLHSAIVSIFGKSRIEELASVALSLAFVLIASIYSRRRDLLGAAPIAAIGSFYLYPHDWLFLSIPMLFMLNEDNWRSRIAVLVFAAAAVEPLLWKYAYLFTVPMLGLFVCTIQRSRDCSRLAPAGTSAAGQTIVRGSVENECLD